MFGLIPQHNVLKQTHKHTNVYTQRVKVNYSVKNNKYIVINTQLATCFGSTEPSSGQFLTQRHGAFNECAHYGIPYCLQTILILKFKLKIYWLMYRVIHKSLRDFRTRLRSNQDRHSRKEHINRQRISPSFFYTRGLGVLPGSTARGQS